MPISYAIASLAIGLLALAGCTSMSITPDYKDLTVILHDEQCVDVAWARTHVDAEGAVVAGAIVRRPLCREPFLSGHVDIDVVDSTRHVLQSSQASISPRHIPMKPPRRSFFRGRLRSLPTKGGAIHIRFHRGSQRTSCTAVDKDAL